LWQSFIGNNVFRPFKIKKSKNVSGLVTIFAVFFWTMFEFGNNLSFDMQLADQKDFLCLTIK
jgi:hypothetical protein